MKIQILTKVNSSDGHQGAHDRLMESDHATITPQTGIARVTVESYRKVANPVLT